MVKIDGGSADSLRRYGRDDPLALSVAGFPERVLARLLRWLSPKVLVHPECPTSSCRSRWDSRQAGLEKLAWSTFDRGGLSNLRARSY